MPGPSSNGLTNMTCLLLAMLFLTACGGGSDDGDVLPVAESLSAPGAVTGERASGSIGDLSIVQLAQVGANRGVSATPGAGSGSAAASPVAPLLPGTVPAGNPVAYPSDEIIRNRPAAIARGDKPAYRVARSLPGYGTKVMRITDPGAFGVSRRVNRHAYSKQQPWNSDGSRVMLHFQWPAVLIDGKGFGFLKTFDPPGDPLWSRTEPDVIYGVLSDEAIFVRYNVTSGAQTALRTFSGYSSIHIGGGEGNLSDDGRLVALIGQRAGGVDIIVYDISANAVLSTGRFDGLTGPHGAINSATVSPSGKYVLLGVEKGGTDRGWDVYDARTMRFLRRLVHDQFSHADLGYTTAGEEVLLTASNGKSAMVSIRLADGVQREELSSGHMTWFNHVSCRNTKRPGWCYISSYDEGNGQYMIRQLFALKLDGSGTVQRFAPAIFADTPDDDEDYTRSPMGVPNQEGTLMLFASDWGNPSMAAPIDAYVVGVDLP